MEGVVAVGQVGGRRLPVDPDVLLDLERAEVNVVHELGSRDICRVVSHDRDGLLSAHEGGAVGRGTLGDGIFTGLEAVNLLLVTLATGNGELDAVGIVIRPRNVQRINAIGKTRRGRATVHGNGLLDLEGPKCSLVVVEGHLRHLSGLASLNRDFIGFGINRESISLGLCHGVLTRRKVLNDCLIGYAT